MLHCGSGSHARDREEVITPDFQAIGWQGSDTPVTWKTQFQSSN
jgi:hypothetical protein